MALGMLGWQSSQEGATPSSEGAGCARACTRPPASITDSLPGEAVGELRRARSKVG